MRYLLTIWLLLVTIPTVAIQVPDWENTYKQELTTALWTEPLIIDAMVLNYLKTVGIDVASLKIEDIRHVNIAIAYLKQVGIDSKNITVFDFPQVKWLGTYLNDSINSVRAEHEITTAKQTGDWTKVLARFGAVIGGKIRQLNEGKKFPVSVGDFFIGADTLSITVFDNATVSFIDFGDSSLPQIKEKFNTDKQVFIGLDYQYGSMELKKLIPFSDKIRGTVSPWNFNNSIDLNPAQYQQAVNVSRWLLRYSKAYMPEVPTFQLTAYDLDGWRQFQSHVDYDVDGYVLWIGRDLWDCRRYDWNEIKRVWESVIGKKPIIVAGVLVNQNQELYLNELIEQLKDIGFAGVIYRVM